MLHFILDGYNIINTLSPLKTDSLNRSRSRLFKILHFYNFTGSPRNKLTVIFDGREDVPEENYAFPFEVKFSKKEKADDLIERIVRRSANPKQMVVVTNDKGLKRRVSQWGASVREVDDFFKKISETDMEEDVARDKFDLTSRQIDFINEELRSVWLDEDNE